ncbi:MAG TPA: hypothetical protein DCF68_04230 [Cyanothece sp. UBA12306]|nr:hypothetical protein [Cyanothece sp. UBA12306]
MNEKILLEKWQTLEPDEQEKVMAFIDNLKKEKSNYKPKTELGKKLWELRQKIVADPSVQLKNWEEIEAEMDEIRGRNR